MHRPGRTEPADLQPWGRSGGRPIQWPGRLGLCAGLRGVSPAKKVWWVPGSSDCGCRPPLRRGLAPKPGGRKLGEEAGQPGQMVVVVKGQRWRK